MNVYEESLVNVLMPDGAPGSWLESEDFAPYIRHLASCGLQKLSSECDALKDEQASLLEQTKELAYKEYLTFIHASDCSKSLHSQLGSLEQQLGRTSVSVSSLHSTLDRFVSTSRSLLVSRQLNSTTLAKHTQLLEILELSQLLDTCVRNGYHDEALEVISYVRRLEKRHGSIPVIKSIVREVQASSQQMLSQLLSQLRSEASLPQCLKVVGLLRTLDVFTECQLRLKFLHARDACLTAALAALPPADPHQHVAKTVETARVHIFDIVTQYKAIFPEEEPSCGTLHPAHLPALLQSWLLYRVSQVLAEVRRCLLGGGVAGSSLESLLAQCLFFGQSLSRIGADFRGLVTTMFVEAGERQLERDIRAANHKFDEVLSCYSFGDAVAPPSLPPGGFLLDSSTGLSSGGRPPLGLLEFPPLAHYLNSLVSALNTLRLCCFTALLPTLLTLLTESLNKVVRSLVELHEVECSGFSAAEAAAFGRLCGAVKTVLLPHLNSTCLRALYPLNHLASVTGSSALQLAKMNFGQLDVEAICLPLKPFLLETTSETDIPDNDSELDPVAGDSGGSASGSGSTADSSQTETAFGTVDDASLGISWAPDAGVAFVVDATAPSSAAKTVGKVATDIREATTGIGKTGTGVDTAKISAGKEESITSKEETNIKTSHSASSNMPPGSENTPQSTQKSAGDTPGDGKAKHEPSERRGDLQSDALIERSNDIKSANQPQFASDRASLGGTLGTAATSTPYDIRDLGADAPEKTHLSEVPLDD